MRLERTLEQYANCTPAAVAGGSQAQMMYFVDAAKKDIATLAAAYDEMGRTADARKVIIAAKDAEIARLRDALGKPFCVLYLDGRNEHGSHALAGYPRSFEVVDSDVDEQAETILNAAEQAGFRVGECVWAEFTRFPDQVGDFGRVELAGYWDFSGINVDMSKAVNARADRAGGSDASA